MGSVTYTPAVDSVQRAHDLFYSRRRIGRGSLRVVSHRLWNFNVGTIIIVQKRFDHFYHDCIVDGTFYRISKYALVNFSRKV